ncbi:MAG: trypsin-like peptidase domain-containing protein [Planctomycetota bacterium]|nr:trypsin-like peptidase domain-containing protein [Planctomycetota bacterium]
MRRFVSFGPSIVVLAAVLAVLALGPAAVQRMHLAGIAARVQLAQARLDDSDPMLDRLNQATRDVADSVLPGVVHIQVRGAARRADPDAQGAERRFSVPRGSGAGWFFNSDGLIITNAHVVEDADVIRVETYDGRVREAEVVGVDPRTDIAVIKVDNVPGITPPRRASGEPIYIGDRVFAFGSPFGIKFSMSQGIVSGVGRGEAASLVGMRGGYTNFIQTDAAMNPGNSGGPLVDIRGRVIGMSSAIANNVEFSFDDAAPQGQSAGIGFAIPIQTIETVASQLIDSGFVIRGYLGIQMETYRPDPQAVGTPTAWDGSGAEVTFVREGHPAAKAGLRAGDVITRVFDERCRDSDTIRSIVSTRTPGTLVPLTVWRAGQETQVPVRIGAAYFGRDGSERIDLIYIEGSESMSIDDIRARVKGPAGAERVD